MIDSLNLLMINTSWSSSSSCMNDFWASSINETAALKSMTPGSLVKIFCKHGGSHGQELIRLDTVTEFWARLHRIFESFAIRLDWYNVYLLPLEDATVFLFLSMIVW